MLHVEQKRLLLWSILPKKKQVTNDKSSQVIECIRVMNAVSQIVTVKESLYCARDVFCQVDQKSVDMCVTNQDLSSTSTIHVTLNPGLYPGPSVYARSSFYPRFYII